MDDKGEKLIRFPLKVLSWCGLNPEQNKSKLTTISLLYFLFGTTNLIFILLQFIYASGSIIELVENLEAISALFQFTGTDLVGAVKLSNFRQMIEDSKHFWSIKKFSGELKPTLEKILRFEHFFVRLFAFVAAFTVILCLLTRQLPTGVWLMTGHEQLHILAFILQELFIPLLAVYMSGFDCLFLSFCVQIRTQYKLLNYLLRDLNVSDNQDEKIYSNTLKSYIQHHDFLLRFSHNMQVTYSPVMLIQYCSALLLLLGQMYVLFESKDTFQISRFALTMVSRTIQLSFYCIPLNYIRDEAVLVSHGMYGSDWHSKHVSRIKTAIPLLIQRSQQEIIFKAGGLVEMNSRTVLSVVRTAYSVCTILRALKKIQ